MKFFKYMILNIANNGKMSDEELEILKNSKVLFDTSGRADLELLSVYYSKEDNKIHIDIGNGGE